MSDSGRKLERLVEAVERQFVADGFSVEVRKREYDEEGRQSAEFDVVVSGRLGSTTVSWLIECRDRPSEGPAPSSWIEQLVGRRGRFNFNKVTAVSTTGFASAATRYAQEQGIELRTVDALDEDEIQNWFKVSNLQLFIHKGEFSKAEIRLEDPIQLEVKDLAKAAVQEAGASTKILKDRHGNEMSVIDAWTHTLNQNPHMFAGVSPGGDPEFRRLFVSFKEPEDQYVITTEAGDATVVGIVLEAKLAVEVREVPISEATRYSLVESGEALAESIRFDVEVRGQPFELGVHRLVQDGRTFIAVRGSSKAATSS